MRETSENLPEPSKKPSPGTPNQKPLRKLRSNFVLFVANFWCCKTTTWGSSPDRSPVAQWLNMRISPASRLPAPRPLPPSLCQAPGVHSKPVPGPASAESPMRRGRVFRNYNTGPNSPPFKALGRPGVGGKPRAAGKVFRNHNAGQNCALFIRFAQLCLAYEICKIVPCP